MKYKVCFVVSSLLTLAFIGKTIVDYSQYTSTLHSSPFYLWIIMNVIYFIVPALVILLIGIIARRKAK